MRLITCGFLIWAALILASFLWHEISHRCGELKGVADADSDLRAGIVGLKGCGKPMYWSAGFKEILANEYSVEYEHVAGCTPTPFQSAYVAGYNRIMKDVLERRGVNVNDVMATARSFANADRDGGAVQ
jgi:hypothetical protein